MDLSKPDGKSIATLRNSVPPLWNSVGCLSPAQAAVFKNILKKFGGIESRTIFVVY
jgi:hypothetical protein